MTSSLQVLLLESHAHEGAAASAQLEAAGHSVLRCHPVDGPSFPCVGTTDHERCPLRGQVDVALDVRRPGTTEPTSLEEGVGCSIRAGIPVVETGGTRPSPLSPWTLPAGTDLASACSAAASEGFARMSAAVLGRVSPTAKANGLDPASLRCSITASWPVLRVHLTGPPIEQGLQQALAVRAADAIRTTQRRSFPQVSFSYEGVSAER